MMLGLFDTIRDTVTAEQVGERAGLEIKRRGSRSWAKCPLHGEKTPSLCFYEDGGWHCFGCNKGGDAVSLYAEIYSTSMIEAARQISADFRLGIDATTPAPKPKAARTDARRVLTSFMNERYRRFTADIHTANKILKSFDGVDDPWSDPKFVEALKLRTIAETDFDRMWAMLTVEYDTENYKCKHEDDWSAWIDLYREEVWNCAGKQNT